MARRELLIDGALAVAVTVVVAVAITANLDGGRGPDVAAYMFAVGLGLLMFVRRQYPALALMATAVGIIGYYTADYPPVGLALPVAAALYSAAEQGRLKLSVLVAAALFVGSTAYRIYEGQDPGYVLAFESPWSIALMAAVIALGDGVRSRRRWRAEQREREAQLIREREQESAMRIERERLALARDVHDVLAHTVAAVTLQANVAAEALEDGDFNGARDAISAIRSATGDATTELRSTVALLREPAGDVPLEPSGSLRNLDRLAEVVDAGSVRMSVQVECDLAAVPAVVDIAAYRIVQEALTNALRHADARGVTVALACSSDVLVVDVTDDGRGRGDADDGHGITAMRERAQLVGGTLTILSGDAGCRVHAELPLSRVE